MKHKTATNLQVIYPKNQRASTLLIQK